MGTSRIRPLLVLSAAGAAGYAARRARQIADVAPDLRTPALWLPATAVPGRGMTLLARLAGARVPATSAVAGVRIREERAARPDGGHVTVRLYEPEGRCGVTGALLWIHGGGHVLGAARMDDDLASAVARDLGILVVGVDYRLAPGDPFPADLDDCRAALTWLHGHAAALQVDPARVAVGGASAGGGLAASLVQWAHDQHGTVPVCFQLLVYPMLDDRLAPRAERRGLGTFTWTPAFNVASWRAYLGAGPDVEPPPYAVPARRTDVSGLPPAWIGVGDLDLFLPEDRAYAQRLRAAGVPCEFDVQPGMYHGADVGRVTPTKAAFRGRMAAALRAGLA